MRHIKTYENKITDLFKKKKKLPVEVFKLAEKIVSFINNNIPNNYTVEYSIQDSNKNKENMPILNLVINLHDLGGYGRFISLYYNEISELMMFSFIQDKRILINIEEFLNNIMELHYSKIKTPVEIASHKAYFIELNSIKDIISDINQEDFDFFIETKKYNL